MCPPESRAWASFSPKEGCAPIQQPGAFSGSATQRSCAMNSHLGVPYFPLASDPTRLPFASLLRHGLHCGLPFVNQPYI